MLKGVKHKMSAMNIEKKKKSRRKNNVILSACISYWGSYEMSVTGNGYGSCVGHCVY